MAMKIALDPYMFRRVPLTDLPGLLRRAAASVSAETPLANANGHGKKRFRGNAHRLRPASPLRTGAGARATAVREGKLGSCVQYNRSGHLIR